MNIHLDFGPAGNSNRKNVLSNIFIFMSLFSDFGQLFRKERKTDTTEHYDVFCHLNNKLKKSILTSLNTTKDECSVFVNFQRIILELTTVLDGRKGQVEA